jgi:hypothetical protein
MILKYTYLHTEINIIINNEQIQILWTLSITLISYNWSGIVSLMNGNTHIHKEADTEINTKTTKVESILQTIGLIARM